MGQIRFLPLLFILALTLQSTSAKPSVSFKELSHHLIQDPIQEFSLLEGQKFLEAGGYSLLQLVYEIVFYDVIDCIDYLFVLQDHLVNGMTAYKNGQFFAGSEQMGLIVHKGTVVYRECYQVYNDTTSFVNNIYKYNDVEFYMAISLNVFFNFIDIYLELQDGKDALVSGDYKRFGEDIGKITSDIFVKSPINEAWRFNNSAVFMADQKPLDYEDPLLTSLKSGIKKPQLSESHINSNYEEKQAMDELITAVQQIKQKQKEEEVKEYEVKEYESKNS